MAFSIRKIISNISYFSKSEDGVSVENDSQNEGSSESQRKKYFPSISVTDNVEFDRAEADSTTKCAKSLNLPSSVKNYSVKKGSLSDTDVLSIKIDPGQEQSRKKCKKLKLDINKANSNPDVLNTSEDSPVNVENTPKHKLLESRNLDLFRNFNFNESFDISDVASSISSYDDNLDIDLLSEPSDSESADTEDDNIKMCRKVELETPSEAVPSATPESFADVELDKNEEERMNQLLNYQQKVDKIESLLTKMLTEFQFHIEVSKIFNSKSIVSALPATDMSDISKALGSLNNVDNTQRGVSPAGWNLIMEKEDTATKSKIKNQLVNIRDNIDLFIGQYLTEKPRLATLRSDTFNLHKGSRQHRRNPVTQKKKIKHYDFPDLRDAMVNLFSPTDSNNSFQDDTDNGIAEECKCCCHYDTESTKSESETNNTISSSIGNFTLDSTTLTAYSESLDLIISYNSFQDSSLYNTLLQKAAIERISFYIQAHSIQLTSEPSNNYQSKSNITFYCPACSITESEENGLLKHILSQSHCEKIHFLYKTAYVKKCIATGKEIMPSTVLNPMTMYRDDNKIVCFGDAVYACSLCFENMIVGESVLMAHCMDEEHLNRRDKMFDIID